MSQQRPDAKFRVGQVVVMKSLKAELPFRVLRVEFYDGDWFYGWDRKNSAAEHMIRSLTPEEVGSSVPSTVPKKEDGLEVESLSR